jgi:hypothetical protein
LFLVSRLGYLRIIFSVLASTADKQSSSTTNSGFFTNERAIEIRCFCPPETLHHVHQQQFHIVLVIAQYHFERLQWLQIFLLFHFVSFRSNQLPNKILFFTVSENKKTSCGV